VCYGKRSTKSRVLRVKGRGRGKQTGDKKNNTYKSLQLRNIGTDIVWNAMYETESIYVVS
jgi:hypothetical protein